MATKPTHGKLVSRLAEISRGPSVPLGFGRPAPPKLPAMALIVALDHNDPSLVTAAVKAGADALVLQVPAASLAGNGTGSLEAEQDALRRVTDAVGTVPWGLSIDGPGAVRLDLDKLAKMGADFVIAPAGVAPASFIAASGLGRLISIERDFNPYLVHTLNELPIDAVAVSRLDATPGPGGLSVLDVMRYRQVVDLVRQPVIIDTQGQIKPEDVPAMRQAGVAGLILDVRTVGTDAASIEATTRAFQEAIAKAGAPLGRGRAVPLVPQVHARSLREYEEPEYPEEPDEDE